MTHPGEYNYQPTEKLPAEPSWLTANRERDLEPEPVHSGAISDVLIDRTKFAWGIAFTAITAGLAAWLLSWLVAILVSNFTDTPERAPQGVVIALLAVILTALTATLLVVLAAYAPRPTLFFYCITGLVALLIVGGPLKINGVHVHTVAQAVVNVVLFAAVVVLVLAIARPTVRIEGK